ncbi:hypothetical protein KEM48_006377 [Puccinia striiformis f. sp. tritici PST-130]|nr:hypothetical protein KEM48_006377 [Puccinia striiformis f. sp. tritici PST-130]
MKKEIPVSDEWVETESKEEEESDSSSKLDDDNDVNSQEWMILNQAHSSYTVVAKRIRRDVSQLHEGSLSILKMDLAKINLRKTP